MCIPSMHFSGGMPLDRGGVDGCGKGVRHGRCEKRGVYVDGVWTRESGESGWTEGGVGREVDRRGGYIPLTATEAIGMHPSDIHSRLCFTQLHCDIAVSVIFFLSCLI